MGGYGGSHKRLISYAHTREWQRGHVPYRCCKGAHVVITGGASGIGLELAKECIARGARAVSIIDVSDCSRALNELKDCAADGPSIVFRAKLAAFQADVSSFDQVMLTNCGRCAVSWAMLGDCMLGFVCHPVLIPLCS